MEPLKGGPGGCLHSGYLEHLADIPLDIPGAFLRLERYWWRDGTSCLHIAKWCVQPETNRVAPWWPPQYTQIPWELAADLAQVLREKVIPDVERGAV